MFQRLFAQTAAPEEKGSFCDTTGQIHYDNVGGFEAEVQMRSASEYGTEVLVLDDTADPDDSFSPEQRFNLYTAEQDSQGTFTPAKNRVGGV